MKEKYFRHLNDREAFDREVEVDTFSNEYLRRFNSKIEAQKCQWLKEFHVLWLQPSDTAIKELAELLDQDCDEYSVQKIIEQYPLLLAKHLRGGHARWVVPQKQLGSEYVTDFLMCEASSVGLQWCAVELESPKHKLFNDNGDPSAKLNHAIRQIQDWRVWLSENKDYACKPKTQSGLGLHDIDSTIPGLIIIGRRGNFIDRPEIRRRILHENNIAIHTYDWLL